MLQNGTVRFGIDQINTTLRAGQFRFFRFVTLTTPGYGDIVPVHPMVRMLVILEGVAGQLFPAILIARLVSLQVQSKQKT